MKSLRHDTLSAIPAPDAEGKTRIEPPRADQRAMLKRLYLQQSWLEILEQADSTFSRGANHLWLDLQWYIHQALVKLGQDVLADIIAADLKGLLRRLTGLETLAFNDGTPFADEVTLNWINQSVLDDMSGWRDEPVSAASERITISWPSSRKRWRKRTRTVWMHTSLAADTSGYRLHKRQMAAAPADGSCGRAEGQK
jgi:type VI secretion system protein VasJ